MFDTIDGLPVHPLVVHGVVVLLPLAALGAIAIALRPAWRRPYGPLVAAIAVVATVLIPVATTSGEEFVQRRRFRPEEHADLGQQLIWFALPFLALVLALVVLDRRGTTAGGRSAGSGSVTLKIVAALVVVAACASTFQVYRIGDAGARSVWSGTVEE